MNIVSSTKSQTNSPALMPEPITGNMSGLIFADIKIKCNEAGKLKSLTREIVEPYSILNYVS